MNRDSYIIVNVGESKEQQILVSFLDYTRRRFGIDSEIIVMVTPQDPRFEWTLEREDIHVIRTPWFLEKRDWWHTFNKLASIKYLTDNYEIRDDCSLFFVDPVMIFIKSFDLPRAEPGKMFAQK